MEEKLFTKKDYLDYSYHEETLVRNWAVEQLKKFYPDDNKVQERIFSLSKKCIGRDRLSPILQGYFEENYQQIPVDVFRENIETSENLLIKAILVKNLAQKNYNEEEILYYIKDILESESAPDANVFIELVSALGNLRTPAAYGFLQDIEEEIELDFMLLGTFCENMFKYRREQDIIRIFRKVITNLAAVGETNLKRILTSYSKLFYGREFTHYLNHILGNEDDLDRILELLERYWSANEGVLALDSLISEMNEAYANAEYDKVFSHLIEQLNNKFVDKYADIVDGDSLPLTIDELISIKDSISEEDFWIGLAVSVLHREQDKVCKQGDIKYIVNFMISLLIVLLEDNNFNNMIAWAEKSVDNLWDAFILDRSYLPEEIIEMVIEQGAVLEDKLINLIENNRYDNYVERTVRVLGEINSRKSIPYLINLLDEHQGDYICEQVNESLKRMCDLINLDDLEKAIRSGDSTRRIFLMDIFGYFPCDKSAQILTDLWEEEVLDYILYEQFGFTLKDIGSSVGLRYLDDIAEDDDLAYIYETLLVLAIINDSDKETVNYYREQINRANNRSGGNLFEEVFKRKAMQEDKSQSLPSGHDDFDKEKYIINEDGTRIKKTDIGRNDPCPCGSGKKYKKCCGR